MPIQPDPETAGVLVGILTLLSGYGAWVVGNSLYLRLAPAVLRTLHGWKHYKAALWGDLLILPVVNGLTVWLLYQLPIDPFGAFWLPILAALAVTVFIHIEQAQLKLVNWTMPKPWRWNSFGFYHALFMAVNLTISFYLIEQVLEWRNDIVGNTSLLAALLLILGGWLGMLLLFFRDRRQIASR